jgi:hypothetical protein
VTIAGLSKLPWLIGPVVVKGRGSRSGRGTEEFVGVGVTDPLVVGVLASSFAEVRTSRPFSKSAPPRVAHFKIV